MVKFKNVSYQLPSGEKVLNDLNFEIQQNEKIAIIGENGSGKTTLGYLLMGILEPTDGKIEWATPLLPTDKQVLMQNPNRQVLARTVREELSLLPTFCNLSESEIQKLSNDALFQLEISGDREMFSLSEGERLKVMIKAITIVPPKLIITDEPTNDLPPISKDELINDILNLPSTVVWFTLSLKEAQKFSRIIVLSKGNMVCDTINRPFNSIQSSDWLFWGIEPLWTDSWHQLQ